MLPAVGGRADDPVTDYADYPDPAFGVESEAVRPGAGAILGKYFACAERAVRLDREATGAAGDRLVHVEPLAARVDDHLVGEADAFCNHPRATLIHHDDVAIAVALAHGLFPGHLAGADRDPGSRVGVDADKIGRLEPVAVDLHQPRCQMAVGAHVPDTTIAQVRDQEAAVRKDGESVRQETRRRIRRGDQPGRTVGAHAADPAPVRHEQVAGAGSQDGLGPLQPFAHKGEIVH